MSKTDESNIIFNLIENEKIYDQHELIEKLKLLNVNIPQSTLSRRLKSLGIAKIENYYQIVHPKKIIQSLVLNLKISPPNLIVLQTFPGHANSIAILLDEKINAKPLVQKAYTSLLGTIAGDDTILLVSDGTKEGLENLKSILEKDFIDVKEP